MQNLVLIIILILAVNYTSRLFIQKMPYWLIAIIFLPGTFLHELSHYLSAKALFVSVGKFNLIPKREDGKIELGSVTIEKTDLIRGSLIGVAPFIVGLLMLNWILKYPINLLSIYIIFEITNTMIPSFNDIKAFIKLGIISVILYVLYYYLV